MRRGFTLIELMIVMAVLGVFLAADMLPFRSPARVLQQSSSLSEDVAEQRLLMRYVQTDFQASLEATSRATGELRLQMGTDRWVVYRTKGPKVCRQAVQDRRCFQNLGLKTRLLDDGFIEVKTRLKAGRENWLEMVELYEP